MKLPEDYITIDEDFIKELFPDLTHAQARKLVTDDHYYNEILMAIESALENWAEETLAFEEVRA